MKEELFRLMIICYGFLFALCFLTSPAIIFGQNMPSDKVKSVEQKLGKLGRYMEIDVTGGCKDATFPHWDGFPLKQCTYNQIDRPAGKPQVTKKASVIMLNPSENVLAKWIVASCAIVIGMPKPANDSAFNICTTRLWQEIKEVSGAQFPVAGIVLEDIVTPGCKTCGGNGIQEAYTFRNGVTVKVQNGLEIASEKVFGNQEIQISLDPNSSIERVRLKARIQSTTREEYKAYMGKKAELVDGENSANWANVIRSLYQDAWKRAYSTQPETVEKYRNDLMVAKTYAMLEKKPPAR